MKSRFNIVLYQPVIPQNTGSIARLCACTGAALHLIRPLGFDISESAVKRAGLDYWPHVGVQDYENWEDFLRREEPNELFFLSKLGKTSFSTVTYSEPTYLVFGNEVQGLPPEIWERYPDKFLTIPMRTHLVRSLNLSQSAAVVLYEAMRQHDYPL